MRKTWTRLAVAAALGCAVAGTASAQTRDVTYLLPAPANQPAFGPWMVALQRGYYKQEGLNVTFMAARGGVDAAKQVGAGNAPIGGALGDTSIIVRANHIPVRAVAVLGGQGFMQLVLNKAKADSVTALKGKAVTTMSYQDTTFFALLGMLAAKGMTKNDINAEAVGPSAVWQLFANGRAAGMASVPEWTVYAMRAAPNAKFDVIPSDTLFKSMAQAIVASDDEIKKEPELIGKLVKATLHGWSDIVADPKSAAADYVKAQKEFADKQDEIVQIFDMYDKLVYPGQPKPGWIDADRLAALQQFYLKQGIIERASPVDELYTEQFVK